MKPAEPRAGRACSACTGFAGRAWRRRAHAGRGARGAAVSYLYLLKFSAPPWWQHNYITAWHDYNCAARMAARRRGGFWFGGLTRKVLNLVTYGYALMTTTIIRRRFTTLRWLPLWLCPVGCGPTPSCTLHGVGRHWLV